MTTLTATETLQEKGLKAAIKFLERQDYKILELGWTSKAGEVDIIATDIDNLIFIKVETHSKIDDGLPEDRMKKKTRQRFEQSAIEYLSHADIRDVIVRFDVISMVVVDEERAFLRHHINALSSSE